MDELACVIGGHIFAIWSSSIQRNCTNTFVLRSKTEAFKKKLGVWDSFVQKGDTEMFSTSNDFLTSVDVIGKELSDIISQHLQELALRH